MRAIGHSTARNAVRAVTLILITAAFARADAHDDVIEVVTAMAGALSETGNETGSHTPSVAKFMSAFSNDMPNRGALETKVTALVSNADVSSSITPLSEDGDEQNRQIELDWLLEIRSLENDGQLVRRREVVHCELRKVVGRKNKQVWKIVALKPIDFFALPNFGK